MRHADGVWNAGMNDIIGVHQQHRSIRIGFRILFERREFITVEHHPAMRHRAGDGNVEHLTGRYRCRTDYTADISRAGTISCRIHIMRTAGAKVRHSPAISRLHNAARLGRNQGLMVDLCQNRRLHQLGINQRGHHRNAGLIRIHNRAFGHGIDIPAKMEVFQILQEFFRKHILLTEIIHILLGELHIFHVFNDLL